MQTRATWETHLPHHQRLAAVAALPRYKALETTFYVVIALLPSLAVYEMVSCTILGNMEYG